MLWLSRHSGIGKKKAASRTALKAGLGNFSRDRCSEIDATAGIEEVEVVERRPYVLQLSIRRDGRIAGHEIDLRRQVLLDRVEMHLGRIDGLIESERPARDLSAGDLGGNRHIGEGARCEKAIGRGLGHSAAVTVARAADTVEDFFIATPEGVVAEGREEAQLALDAQLHFPGIHERSARSGVEARMDRI